MSIAEECRTTSGSLPFELLGVDLVFKSIRPNYIRHGIAKAAGAWVNRNTRSREKYEERYCYLFPCYKRSSIDSNESGECGESDSGSTRG